MNKLREFMKELSREEQHAFAKRCGTSRGYILQIMYGYNRPGLHLSCKIREETNSFVTIQNLRPDREGWFKYDTNG